MRKHLWAILLVAGLGSSRSIAAENLRVGAAASVITPPAGTPMAGYYFERAAEGVHDDLYAKALVLEQGGTKAALVSLDLISTPLGLVESARKEIERTTRIPGRNVMISATHAHTGPVLAGRGLRDDALGAGNDLVRRYTEYVARQDRRGRTPGGVRSGTGHRQGGQGQGALRWPSTAGST